MDTLHKEDNDDDDDDDNNNNCGKGHFPLFSKKNWWRGKNYIDGQFGDITGGNKK